MNALSALLSHGIAERIGWTLLHSLWQATAVTVLLAIVLRFLAKSSAQRRYATACLALAAMVLLPAATGGWLSSPAQNVVATPRPISPPPSSPPAVRTEPARARPPMVPTHPPSEQVNEQTWREAAAERLESILPFAVRGWLLGVLLLSLRHALAWTRLRQLRRRQIRSVEASLHERLSMLARRVGVDRAVQLVESALVQVPTVIGWLRPMILLPVSAVTGLDRDQLEALLLHELAHIRRCDYLVNLAQTVVEILGFYHPAVWWVSHRIRVERENCCDDVAARALGDNLRYARALASMEDLRAGRPELALAASGGSLLARIRRLAGGTPAEDKPSPWAPALVAVVLVFAVAIPAGLALADYYTSPATALEREVVKGFVENRAKFTCGALAWTSTTEQSALLGQPVPPSGLTLAGQYQLWWDGEKVATRYTREEVHSSRETPSPEIQVGWQGDDGRPYWIGQSEGGNVYTGGLLAREPRWRSFENWLLEVIRWRGVASLDKRILESGRAKHMAVEWSTVDVDGSRLIRRVAENIDPTDVSHSEYIIEHYDPAKGYGLVREEWYMANGVRRLNRIVRLEQVIPSGWFPTEVSIEMNSIRDGSLLVRHQLTLDLTRCRFNDKAALPEGLFEMTPHQEQNELRQILADVAQERMGIASINAAIVTQGPRAVVEGFIAAAIQRDYGKAALFVHPGPSQADANGFTELLAGRELRVMAVFADDKAALVVTSAIRIDGGGAGPLTFQVERSADAQVGWLIDDIDVETPQGAKEEIERFLQRHPNAAMTVEDGEDAPPSPN